MEKEESGMDLSGRKILVAEDEPDQLNFIKTVLEDHGAHVIVAQNGTDALEMARAEIPHAMTLDINMPGMDVMNLLGELKHDDPPHPSRSAPERQRVSRQAVHRRRPRQEYSGAFERRQVNQRIEKEAPSPEGASFFEFQIGLYRYPKSIA
jgi:CheY-like chemotaxis protein